MRNEVEPSMYYCPTQEEISTTERVLRGVLGFYYDGIFEFIKDTLSSRFNMDLKVFMTRRGYVLYKMFVTQLASPEEGAKSKVITSYGLYCHLCRSGDISGKTLLVIDDALKQGRNMLRLRDSLIELGVDGSNIKTRALAKCKEAQENRARSQNKDNLASLSELYDNTDVCYEFEDWKNHRIFADSLTWSFHAVLEPYVAYLPVMRIEKSRISEEAIECEGTGIETYKGNNMFCSYRFLFSNYFANGCDGEEQVILSECVRVYENDSYGYASVVPHLVFKDSALEAALNDDGFGPTFSALIGDGFSLGVDGGDPKSEKGKMAAGYKCKLAIYLSSLIYGVHFMKSLGIPFSELRLDLDGFKMNFGEDLAAHVGELLKTASLDKIFQAFPSRKREGSGNTSGSDGFKNAFYTDMESLLDDKEMSRSLREESSRDDAGKQENRNMAERFMEAAMRRCGKFDEKELDNKADCKRTFGIPQEWPYERLTKFGFDRKRVFAAALTQVDRAIAAKKIHVDEKDGRYVVMQRYTAGERAYIPTHPEYIIMLYVIHRINEEFKSFMGDGWNSQESIAARRKSAISAYKKLASLYCAENGLSYIHKEAEMYLDIDTYNDDNLYQFYPTYQFTVRESRFDEGRDLVKLLDIGSLLLLICGSPEYFDEFKAFKFEAFSKHCEEKNAPWLAKIAISAGYHHNSVL